MESIKNLEIYNFQSHKDTKIKFDKGLNVITGPSDQGKSAIIRALRWVLYNEPRGDDFIRHNEKECHVGVELASGFKIIRKRTPSKNRYILINPEGEEKIFERVGSGVPDEILAIHRMGKVGLDSNDEISLNIDYQLDGAFLLTDSGSNRAKMLGRLINVHLVDRSIRKAKNDINKFSHKGRELEEGLIKDKEILNSFAHLDRLKREVEDKKILLKDFKRLRSRLISLTKVKDNLRGVESKVKELEVDLKRLQFLDPLKKLYQKLLAKHKRFLEGDILVRRYIKLRDDYSSSDRLISKLGDLEEVSRIYNQLISNYNKFELANKLEGDYKDKEGRLKIGISFLSKLGNVDKVDKTYQKIREVEETYLNYYRLSNDLKDIGESFKGEEDILKKTKGVEEVKSIVGEEIPNIEKKIGDLKAGKLRLDGLKGNIERKVELLKVLSKVEDIKKFKEDLDTKAIYLTKLKGGLLKYNNTLQRLEKEEDKLSNLNSNIEVLAQDYSEILKEIGRCPTCFEEIEDEKIDEIVKELKGE